MIKWNNQKNNQILERYYYLFSKDELDDMVSNNFHNIQILETGIQCFNYYLICKKF